MNNDNFDPKALNNKLYEKYGIDQIAIERRFGKTVALHHVSVPRVGEDGFYRSVLTLGGFTNRELNRVYGEDARNRGVRLDLLPFHYSMQSRRDWEFREICTKQSMVKAGISWNGTYPNAPCVEHESIWDFYKSIGYDYKRKRFLKEGEEFK